MRRLFFLAVLLVACTASAAEVRVFAAASLREALSAIAGAYERNGSDKIVFSFGASSLLARQIQEGAPADLFLSADEEKMNALAQRGLIVPRSRVSVLSNSLVIVVPKSGGKKITSSRQLASLQSLALAEPNSVPAGIYARKYLQKIGVWNEVKTKVIPTDNVRSALAAVESGNVDAAIVYKTDALISKEVRVAYEVPRADAPEISYPFALVTNDAAARRFLAHLRSPAALRVFATYGFAIR
ncbi:MAG TPA: molybdate ABC transporter substrate-binding protein [Thermoanaerobaculia bacterium]|jgi:molybdate transport system substrate-binding protein